jgi:hypothetical protein
VLFIACPVTFGSEMIVGEAKAIFQPTIWDIWIHLGWLKMALDDSHMTQKQQLFAPTEPGRQYL